MRGSVRILSLLQQALFSLPQEHWAEMVTALHTIKHRTELAVCSVAMFICNYISNMISKMAPQNTLRRKQNRMESSCHFSLSVLVARTNRLA